MPRINNALLIPYRPADHLEAGQILVQDRRGHRPPPWGFFGGGIEEGETSLQAVLRETWEELGLRLNEERHSVSGRDQRAAARLPLRTASVHLGLQRRPDRGQIGRGRRHGMGHARRDADAGGSGRA